MSFGNQQADFYRDVPEAVAQAVMTTLKLWRGEWFLNTQSGTPYSQAALGVNKSNTASLMIREQILKVQGVQTIDSFSYTFDPINRTASIAATITTDYGQTQVRGII